MESTFLSISVSGEVSRPTYHSSGHIYFTLKDKNSAISCVMFKGNNAKLRFKLEEGLKIIVHGGITVYSPRGAYQINCVNIEADGIGSLSVAYEQLKSKLSGQGYFDINNKKTLPKYPKCIVLVTSSSGAALQDMLRVASSRWPLVNIKIINTLVQGENAKIDIANNITKADKLNADIIVVARGGGSIEDLWAFNEECVADAIYECHTPVVSAIGHEIDTLISDLTADKRAPTPSAAMEMILPDINEAYQYIDDMRYSYDSYIKNILLTKHTELDNLKNLYQQNSIISKIQMYLSHIESLHLEFNSRFNYILDTNMNKTKDIKAYFNSKIDQIISAKTNNLNFLKDTFKAHNPKNRDTKGIAHLEKDGKKLDLKKIKKNDEFTILDATTSITAKRI